MAARKGPAIVGTLEEQARVVVAEPGWDESMLEVRGVALNVSISCQILSPLEPVETLPLSAQTYNS